jgi:hypothetical protein
LWQQKQKWRVLSIFPAAMPAFYSYLSAQVTAGHPGATALGPNVGRLVVCQSIWQLSLLLSHNYTRTRAQSVVRRQARARLAGDRAGLIVRECGSQGALQLAAA